MSGPAEWIDLQRLCRSAQVLDPGAQDPAKPHPLGLGIRKDHKYTFSTDHPVRLPKRTEALQRITEVTSSPIRDFTPALSRQAWRTLLGRPTLIVRLPPPGDEECIEHNIFVTGSQTPQLRRLGLAVVVHPPELILEKGELSGVPLAGVARLTILADPQRPEISLEAWFEAVWLNNTVSFCEELEKLYGTAIPEVRKVGTRKRLVMLITEDTARNSVLCDRLVCVSAVAGLTLEVATPREIDDNLLDMMKSASPRMLAIEKSLISRAHRVINNFTAATGRSFWPLGNAGSMPAELRDAALSDCGVSHGLLPLGRPTVDAGESGKMDRNKPRLPISREGRNARHQRFGLIVEDLDDGFWYSHDNARHSRNRNVLFKRFRESARGLHRIADLDDDGNVIDGKHQSDVGAFIPWNDLNLVARGKTSP